MKREFLKKVIVSGMAMLTVTTMYTVSASAKWVKDSNDNWNWAEDGAKAVGWKIIDGSWYYFNNDGKMYTGWLKDGAFWYNLSNGGQMDVGWKQIDGKWYYFNENGQMSVGWINDNGTQYFTNENGEMQTGTVKIDNKTYTFSESGALLNSNSTSQEQKVDSANSSNVGYVATNSDYLNVRSDATISSDIIGTIAKGAEVKIVDDEKNGFYPIILSGKKGWVSSQWISLKASGDSVTQLSVNPPVVDSGNSNNLTSLSITNENKNQKVDNVKLGAIRDKAPSLDNKYYYSDDNFFYKNKLSPPFSSGGRVITGNCTWYAWGRAWELTGNKPDGAGFIGNAYEWWDANKTNRKYQYGSEPRVGAIAVWKSSLPGSDGSGHVAIVEKIDNGKIYISESTWHGGVFAYKEIYSTEYLYGYIYLDKQNN